MEKNGRRQKNAKLHRRQRLLFVCSDALSTTDLELRKTLHLLLHDKLLQKQKGHALNWHYVTDYVLRMRNDVCHPTNVSIKMLSLTLVVLNFHIIGSTCMVPDMLSRGCRHCNLDTKQMIWGKHAHYQGAQIRVRERDVIKSEFNGNILLSVNETYSWYRYTGLLDKPSISETPFERDSVASSGLRNIYIGGLFELSGIRGSNGLSELKSAELAVNDVNDKNVVPGYRMNLLYNNTQVRPLTLVATKPVFGVSDKARFKLVSSATEIS